MKIQYRLLLVALALGLSHRAVRAASIGVNFNDPSATTDDLAPTDSAGAAPFAQTNWNSVSATAGSLILKDNTGTATTATLTTTGASFSVYPISVSGGDERLNNGFAFNNSTSWSFTVNNIPYANYNLLVYDLGYLGADVKGISAAGTTFYTSSPNPADPGYLDNNAATPYTYTPSASTNSAAPVPSSDYVLFTGLSGGSQTVTISSVAGSGGRTVGGFQIVAVPEPSTWLAAGLLAVGVGVRHWRGRRGSARNL